MSQKKNDIMKCAFWWGVILVLGSLSLETGDSSLPALAVVLPVFALQVAVGMFCQGDLGTCPEGVVLRLHI